MSVIVYGTRISKEAKSLYQTLVNKTLEVDCSIIDLLCYTEQHNTGDIVLTIGSISLIRDIKNCTLIEIPTFDKLIDKPENRKTRIETWERLKKLRNHVKDMRDLTNGEVVISDTPIKTDKVNLTFKEVVALDIVSKRLGLENFKLLEKEDE